jgi:hypothetical protein
MVMILCLVWGCRENDMDLVLNVEEEFLLDMREAFKPGEPGFEFLIKSIEPTYCEESRIVAEHYKDGSEIYMQIKHISAPISCNEEADQQLVEVLTLDHLQEKIYRISFAIRDLVVNHGFLTLSDDRYTLRFESTDGFLVSHTELLKIPQNTVWGYLTTNNAGHLDALEEFLQELGNPAQPDIPPGFYGHFKVDEYGTLNFEQVSMTYHAGFIFEEVLPAGQLSEIVRDFREKHGNTVEVHLYNTQGEKF